MTDTTELMVRCTSRWASGDAVCALCGWRFEQTYAAVTLCKVRADFKPGDGGITYVGDVCPDCLRKGSAIAAEVARDRAREVRARAEYLESLAGAVAALPPNEFSPAVLAEVEAYARAHPYPDDAPPTLVEQLEAVASRTARPALESIPF